MYSLKYGMVTRYIVYSQIVTSLKPLSGIMNVGSTNLGMLQIRLQPTHFNNPTAHFTVNECLAIVEGGSV